MQNIYGLGLSFLFIVVLMVISSILYKKKVLGIEGSRKFIHIGVSNWWIFVVLMFDSLWVAMILPIVFIIFNTYSYKKHFIVSMERKDNQSLGTIYYPIALLILVVLSYTIINPILAAIGVFILGYGDGLASLFGIKYGIRKVYKHKTWIGSITMFIISYMIAFIFLLVLTSIQQSLIYAFIIAIFATLIELYAPKGLDNLTVPLGVTLIAYILMNI